MFMLWGTATSLLIHNTGLPIGVLYSFANVLVGMSVAWLAITLHQELKKRGYLRVKSAEGKSRLRVVFDRMFTLKALHGALMFVSWINIAGRVFVTPLSGDFECYTQPAFKTMPSTHHLTDSFVPGAYIPTEDPKYSRLPWAYKEDSWLAMMLLVPFFISLVVGSVYVLLTVKTKPRHVIDSNSDTESSPLQK
jgi:hypothetical protein